jgi:SPP1 family predicted phage head-tail adaptor
MNPGELNKRITFLAQSSQQNSYGEVEHSWNDIETVWANVKTLQGRELFQAQQVHSEITSKIIVRYLTGITANMRIRYGSRILQIIGPPINVDEKNRYLELSCKEVI